MLALIAAGRPGGDDGPPVYFTVPWSASIAERGQLPGEVYRSILAFVRQLAPSDPKMLTAPDAILLLSALAAGWPWLGALGLLVARRVAVDLKMVTLPTS